MKKLGFTLIELLAVIIILGILMLVAIPSVTIYVSNSRKNSYIVTARQYIKAATNMVNEGKHDFYDTEATYYIPIKCLHVESGGDSPYGKFDRAYVIVTYDNDTFNYYWVSRDVTGQGIKKATLADKLDPDLIEAGIKQSDIKTNATVEGKLKTTIMNDNTCVLDISVDNFSYGVDESKIVNNIYHADDPETHDDGYTVVPEPDFDFASLPDYTTYCSVDHSLDTTFRNTVSLLRVKTMYSHFFYTGEDGTTKVKLYYNFPKFRKNSDGSMHTVKQFIGIRTEKFYDSEGKNAIIQYACSATDLNRHVVDCDVRPPDFVMPFCAYDAYYCINGDGTGTNNEYYVLDNGDVLEAWRTAKYNGAMGYRYWASNHSVSALVNEFDYTFSEYK